MKKTLLAATLITFLMTAPAVAQTMEKGGMQPGMQGDQQEKHQAGGGQGMKPCMMGGKGMTGGKGMMGGGQGMMPCMMGGTMMSMMGHSGMMKSGMMSMMGGGHSMMQSQDDLKKYEKFVNETREMRRKLHNLKFEYGEARWNPATTLGDLRRMTEEMDQLQSDIQKKMVQ